LGAVFRRISVHAESLPIKAEPTPTPLARATATPTPATVASYPGLFPPPRPITPNPEAVPGATPAALPDGGKNDSGKWDELPKIAGLAMVQASSAGIAEFAWDPPALPASIGTCTYQLEVRRLSLESNHKLSQTWIAVNDVQFAQKANRMTGTVTGIPPGITDTLRVVALTARGEPCAISTPLSFHIPAPFQIFTLRNVMLAGFVSMLLCALAIRVKEMRMK